MITVCIQEAHPKLHLLSTAINTPTSTVEHLMFASNLFSRKSVSTLPKLFTDLRMYMI